MKIFLTLCLLIIACLPQARAAGVDDALYAPVAPAGSAFFRFIIADPAARKIAFTANGKKYHVGDFKSVSPYYILTAGNISFNGGTRKLTAPLEEKKFYTLVLSRNNFLILNDFSLKFKAKSLISFYNLTSQEKLTLKLPEQNINVIDAVKSYQNASREINPVKIPLAVFGARNEKLIDCPPLSLERGFIFSVIIFENGNKLETETVKSMIDTAR